MAIPFITADIINERRNKHRYVTVLVFGMTILSLLRQSVANRTIVRISVIEMAKTLVEIIPTRIIVSLSGMSDIRGNDITIHRSSKYSISTASDRLEARLLSVSYPIALLSFVMWIASTEPIR
jgi:hypothetical protein